MTWKQLFKEIRPRPLFGEQKLRLAFEYAITLSDVAKQLNIEITPEIVDRAEGIILKEFTSKSPERVAIEMIPNILAMLEPKDL